MRLQRGKGPALIIVHGLLGSQENWNRVAAALSSDFSVFTAVRASWGEFGLARGNPAAEDVR
jgi:hypothetical protein